MRSPDASRRHGGDGAARAVDPPAEPAGQRAAGRARAGRPAPGEPAFDEHHPPAPS